MNKEDAQAPRYATAEEVAEFEDTTMHDEASFAEVLCGKPEVLGGSAGGVAGGHLTFVFGADFALAAYDDMDAVALVQALTFNREVPLSTALMTRIDGRHALEWTWGDFESGFGGAPGWTRSALHSETPCVFYAPRPGEDLMALTHRNMFAERDLPPGAIRYTPSPYHAGTA